MKKIMFNDKYSLTESVLSGNKTMTRRIITPEPTNIRHWSEKFRKSSNCFYRDERGLCELHSEDKLLLPKYKVGEVVAVAQSYGTISDNISKVESIERGNFYCTIMRECYPKEDYPIEYEEIAGWNNKMFVRADLMPHQVRILNVRSERLQDITEEDCLREGVYKATIGYYIKGLTANLEKESHTEHEDGKCYKLFPTPKEAYASLIDKISGKGTWKRNPFVWVYEFELIK